MSMDDTHALAAAIVTGQDIQLQTFGLRTIKARIIFATITCDHRSGEFSGSVNYLIEGDQYVKIDAFYNLWKEGWSPAK